MGFLRLSGTSGNQVLLETFRERLSASIRFRRSVTAAWKMLRENPSTGESAIQTFDAAPLQC
jgi:hypothetical protein